MPRVDPVGMEVPATVTRGENNAAIDPHQIPTRALPRISMQVAGTPKDRFGWKAGLVLL